MNHLAAAALLSTVLLSACSTAEGEFPSLSRRPFETLAQVAAPATAPVIVATNLPSDVRAKVNALQAQHRKAQNAFAALLPSVRSAASAAALSVSGSESWVNAQLMVSRLDKVRSDSTAASAEIDRLVSGQLDAESIGTVVSLVPLLLPIQSEIAAAVTTQNSEIERLSRLIGQ